MVQLVAIPPIHLPSFSKWDPQRKDDVFLYVNHHNNNRIDSVTSNREAYRYKLTIIDHPSLTVQRAKPIISRRGTKSSTQRRGTNTNDVAETPSKTPPFTYTNAVFLIPAGRETEYIFSSLSGLRSILKSANTARLIAVAFGRNFSSASMNGSPPSLVVNDSNMSIDVVQEELRYVVQMIASAIPNETLEVSLTMKPDTTTTFYPFLALNGIGQRDIIDTGTTTCSGRYIVEQCAITSSSDDNDDDDQQQWVRRLYFLDGNPNVIQSEVYVSCIESNDGKTIVETSRSTLLTDIAWKVDKSISAFDYHKSLTAGLLAFLPAPNQQSNLTYNGLLIGLGGGCLINFWHYIHGDIDHNVNRVLQNHNRWNVTAVELDEAIVQIASKNFGLSVGHPSLCIKIGDGLDVYSTESTSATMKENPNESRNEETNTLAFQKESLDYIVLDVDSKETGAGMSCPPESFVNTSYLQTLLTLLHPDRGILAINVAARDIQLFHKTCRAVRCVFPYIFLSKQYPNQGERSDVMHEFDTDKEPEDLNVVVFATRNMLHTENFLTSISDWSDRVGKWMQVHNYDTDDSTERALVHSILKECLTDFVPYEGNDEEVGIVNDSSSQDTPMHTNKSGNNGKRRKNRGGNNKKR